MVPRNPPPLPPVVYRSTRVGMTSSVIKDAATRSFVIFATVKKIIFATVTLICRFERQRTIVGITAKRPLLLAVVTGFHKQEISREIRERVHAQTTCIRAAKRAYETVEAQRHSSVTRQRQNRTKRCFIHVAVPRPNHVYKSSQKGLRNSRSPEAQ